MRPVLLAIGLLVLCGCTEEISSPRVEPAALAFGEVAIGSAHRLTVKVTNPTERSMEVTFAADKPFAVGFTRASIPPGASVDLPIDFVPTESKDFAGGASVFGGKGSVAGVQLTGRGVVGTEDGCGTPGTCNVYRRVDGGCELAVAPNGTPCVTRCAPQGLCVGGMCEGFNTQCDDGDPCTIDSCSEDQGCMKTNVTCTSPSKCQTAYCDPLKGCALTNVSDNVSCGSEVCGAVDVCQAGACVRLNQTTPNCKLGVCGGSGRPLDACSEVLCFENPLPVYGGFSDGHARAANDILFVNREAGAIFHWDGGTFTLVHQPGGYLNSILAKADNDIWVTGNDAYPRHWDGVKWTASPLIGSDRCNSLARTSSGEVVCAGYTRLYVLTPGSATSIGGDTGQSIVRGGGGATWTVSTNQEIRRVLGSAGTTSMGTLSSGPRDLTVDSLGRAWIATTSNGLVRWDNTGASTVSGPSTYVDAVGTAGNRVLALMGNGALYAYDGESTPRYLGSPGNTGGGFSGEQFTAANENDIWIQGNYELLHFDGLTTVPVTCGGGIGNFDVVRTTADGGAFAAAYNQLYRRDTSRWVLMASGGSSYVDLWPASPTEVYGVTNNGQVLRATTSSASATNFGPSGRYAMSVWGTSTSNLYAGMSGQANDVLYQYDGGSWSRSAIPDAGTNYAAIYSVHGSGANDVWALGRDQNTYRSFVWHYDGTTWRDMAFPATTQETGTIRRHGDKVRVSVKYQYYFYEWNGSSWTVRSAPYATQDFAEINGELYGYNASGSFGAVIHFANDGGYSTVRTFNSVGIESIAPFGDDSLLISGNSGFIAKLRP